MTIDLGDFRLIQQEVGWDIVEIVTSRKMGDGTINKPTGEEYQKESEIAYNMQLHNALEHIIHLRTKKNESTVSLNKFLTEYRKEKQELFILTK